jgi:hypothetical protein
VIGASSRATGPEFSDDVPGLGERVFGLVVQVDRVAARRNSGQQMPVTLRHLDHVINAGIVGNVHLGQTKVGSPSVCSGTTPLMIKPPCAAAVWHMLGALESTARRSLTSSGPGSGAASHVL